MTRPAAPPGDRQPASPGGAGPARPGLAVRLAVACLAVNVLIVLTGALVRLTGSGLGCPTWPRCTDTSFVTTPEMGLHGVVEFGNRVVGIVVGLVTAGLLLAVLGAVRARRRAPSGAAVVLTAGVLCGVVAQGLVGGLSVRRELAPEIVAAHFLASMVLVAALTVLVDLLRRPGVRWVAPPERAAARIVAALPVLLAAVLLLGVVVTGAGPHAGDEGARRFGVDSAVAAQWHGNLVFVLVATQVAAVIALRTAPVARRAAALLLVASVSQGVIGAAQYVLGLPVPLVAAHVLGAALITVATTQVVLRTWRVGAGSPRSGAAERRPGQDGG